MAKSSKSQFAILGMLAILRKSSGYELKKHMESSTQYFWKETFSSIYPVLEDLEKQKLIIKVEEPSKNDRKCNIYTLTPEGRDTLVNWLMQPSEDMQLRNELMLKIYFGTMVPIEVNIEHLEKYKKKLEQKLLTFKEIKKNSERWKHQIPNIDPLESLYWLITLDHGINQATASLEWCNNAIKTLKSVEV